MLALDPLLLRMAAALAVGLLLGVERGWSLRGEIDGSRVAGIRTFVLLAMAGGVAGVVATSGAPLIAAAIVVAAAAILLVAYAPELTQWRDATSAVAAVLALAVGAVAGLAAPVWRLRWLRWCSSSWPCEPNCTASSTGSRNATSRRWPGSRSSRWPFCRSCRKENSAPTWPGIRASCGGSWCL